MLHLRLAKVSVKACPPSNFSHSLPPYAGEGLLHDLDIENVPVPQVFVQTVFNHVLHEPLTKG